MARKFFLVAAGMFLIALSFHLGFTTATAQAPANSVVAVNSGGTVAYTANGDVYEGSNFSGPTPINWTWKANIFVGSGPIQTQRATFGQVKARYAPSAETPTSETNDR